MKKILASGKFIRLVIEDGWEYAERVNCSKVVFILAVTGEKKIILVKQFRIPVSNFVIELPAGLVGDDFEDESAEKAAIRELEEETGWRANEMKKITFGPLSAGLSSEIGILMLAKDMKKVSKGGGVENENIQVIEVELNSAEDFLKSEEKKGVLIDPKVYTGLYFAKKYC